MPENTDTQNTEQPNQQGQAQEVPQQDEQHTEQQAPPEGDMDQLPDWARDAITKANDDAAKRRVELRNLQQAQEAQQQEQQQFREKMLAAFGLTPEGEEQADPDALVKSVTEERDATQRELNLLREQVAVTAATPQGVDAAAVLRFLRGGNDLADLDPTASDYSDQVKEKVEAVVEQFPGLRTRVVPPSSGQAPTPTAQGGPKLTQDDLDNMTAEEVYAAQKSGQLNHLLSR